MNKNILKVQGYEWHDGKKNRWKVKQLERWEKGEARSAFTYGRLLLILDTEHIFEKMLYCLIVPARK